MLHVITCEQEVGFVYFVMYAKMKSTRNNLDIMACSQVGIIHGLTSTGRLKWLTLPLFPSVYTG